MKPSQSESVTLSPVLDITAATPLVAELVKMRGKDVTVHAAAVEKIGAQCIQVLLSAAATWSHDGMEFEVAEPSEAFSESLQTMGLEVADMSVGNV
ncbi:STAS domain-containing protein [Nitratireductor sp. CAU 1489]|uniref:STAS domain-containing protein n=1 Tax=Nitratireductor arenosus TaxID=2682096 RepID=A0A844QII8_9HYPH|nr:STAS domain-containing protein [Nitratireductor arenosus]MVA98414.1 STAS domain-containing protein [Nitratireductor arenosus]